MLCDTHCSGESGKTLHNTSNQRKYAFIRQSGGLIKQPESLQVDYLY